MLQRLRNLFLSGSSGGQAGFRRPGSSLRRPRPGTADITKEWAAFLVGSWPRLHFLDSGLVCYLLGIRDGATLEHHPLRGAVFESFVVSELVKAFAALGRAPPLFFWRDATGHEIDILIDAGDRLIPVEVKSGRTVTPGATDQLAWWTALPDNPNRGGGLVHGGDAAFTLKGFRVAPWFLTHGSS